MTTTQRICWDASKGQTDWMRDDDDRRGRRVAVWFLLNWRIFAENSRDGLSHEGWTKLRNAYLYLNEER